MTQEGGDTGEDQAETACQGGSVSLAVRWGGRGQERAVRFFRRFCTQEE